MDCRYAEPIQFCPECGKRIRVEDDGHAACVAWGIQTKKYTVPDDWLKACIENGERVIVSLGIRNSLSSFR